MSDARIYMDACCFIDMAKNDAGKLTTATVDDLWHLHRLMDAAKNKDIEIYTATLTIAECTHINDQKDSQTTVSEETKILFKKMLTSGQVVILVQDTVLVAQKARDLLWVDGVNFRGADAIHVASAFEAACSELITTDNRISKHKDEMAKKGLRIIPPRDTMLLPGEYRQTLLMPDHPAPEK